MNKWFAFLRFILYPLGKLLFPCKVMDIDKYKKYGGGQILVSNHLSWMDVTYVFFGLPGGYVRALSKKENSGGKLQRAFLKSVGVIFIDRDKPELSSMRECLNALKDGETLYICPEGTRNRENRELLPFHSGAAMFAVKGQARVIPYVVHHKGKMFRRNYLGVGDPVDISDYYGKRVDESVLTEVTRLLKDAVQKTLDKLDIWVEQKGYKTEKRRIKREKKQKKAEMSKLQKQYEAARKEEKRACRK